MASKYDQIFENNRKWAADKKAGNEAFFENLGKGQDPDFLYIGCSDSRVSTEELMGVEPGEVFVHRISNGTKRPWHPESMA